MRYTVRKLVWSFILLPSLIGWGSEASPLKFSPRTQIGIISYWDIIASSWNSVPAGSTLLINPADGILKEGSDKPVDDVAAWADLVNRLRARQITVLGYVATGYFKHSGCKAVPNEKCQPEPRIRLQVKTYYTQIPSLSGIFYDEASPQEKGPSDFKKEYGLLRSINNLGRVTVFNVGWPSEEAIKAAKSGEHLVLYESSPFKYNRDYNQIAALTHTAQQNGIVVWHLLHSVCREDLCSTVGKVVASGADYGYVTDIGGDYTEGENTWGNLPRYWDEELAAFSSGGKPCG